MAAAQSSERLLKAEQSEKAMLIQEKLAIEAESLILKHGLAEAKAAVHTTEVKLQDAIALRTQERLEQAQQLEEIELTKNELLQQIFARDQKLSDQQSALTESKRQITSLQQKLSQEEVIKDTLNVALSGTLSKVDEQDCIVSQLRQQLHELSHTAASLESKLTSRSEWIKQLEQNVVHNFLSFRN